MKMKKIKRNDTVIIDNMKFFAVDTYKVNGFRLVILSDNYHYYVVQEKGIEITILFSGEYLTCIKFVDGVKRMA